MEHIVFDEGLKSYNINGDESRVITFNPNDANILKRFKDAEVKLDNITKDDKYKVDTDGTLISDNPEDDLIAIFDELDNQLRDIVDGVFNAKVYDIAFNGVNPLATSNGKTILENFMVAMSDVVKKETAAENKKAMASIKKYQKAYKKI